MLKRRTLGIELLEDRCTPSSGLSMPDHVVIVVEENRSYDEIIGNPNAPYINALASQGALLTNYFAIEHPSEPNYLDLFSGSNQGVTADGVDHPGSLGAPNLASELLHAGLSWGAYVEGLTSGVGYDHDHAPWDMFNNVDAPATIHDFSAWPTDFNSLPTVSIVTPNVQDDMHNGSIQQGDAWLQNNIGAYAQWAQTHNSLLVVVWDEDNGSQNNHVPAILVGQGIIPGQYGQQTNHFGLLATLEDLFGLPGTGGAATATTIDGVLSSPPPQMSSPSPQMAPLSLFQANLRLFIDGAELVLDAHGFDHRLPLPSANDLVNDIRATLPQAGQFGIFALAAGANAANDALQGVQ